MEGKVTPDSFQFSLLFSPPSTLPFSDEFLLKIGSAGYGKGNRMYRVETGKTGLLRAQRKGIGLIRGLQAPIPYLLMCR